MRLKTVVFYQGVKLWDGNLFQTVQEGPNKGNKNVTISIENHIVTLHCEGQLEGIMVGTSNMREARYWREPSSSSGKISRESHSQNPTGASALGRAVEGAAESILGSPKQEGQSPSVSTNPGSTESSGQVGVSEGGERGSHEGNKGDLSKSNRGPIPGSVAGAGFDPAKYMKPTPEKKVGKPAKAKKETK